MYPDERSLVPFLRIDYASRESDPHEGRRHYLFANHLGCIERVVDDAGRTEWRAELGPYGARRIEAPTGFEQPLRWPGHYQDEETGLHYNRFRYYDPTLGRYLESDPQGLAGGLNLYAYTRNPLVSVDLRGLSDVCPTTGRPIERAADADGADAERPPRDPNSREGVPEHAQTIPERQAAIEQSGSGDVPDYAQENPHLYYYDPGPPGRYRARPGARIDRATVFPSGYRQGTLDAMVANHSVQGRQLAEAHRQSGGRFNEHGVPVDANGNAIVPRDANGQRVGVQDLNWVETHPDGTTSVIQHSADDPITFDHITPTSTMFNEGASVGGRTYPPGSDAPREVRSDFYNDPNNMRPMLRSDNSARGGERYTQTTGDNFSN